MHNQTLFEHIQAQIRQAPGQQISFRDYMEMCLYHETEGYYLASREKIGRSGDFYTSAAIGGLLAETVAEWLVRRGNQSVNLEQPLTFVEWGGGTGKFAADFLHALAALAPYTRRNLSYIMIEKSGSHRLLQQATFGSEHRDISWLTEEQWLAAGPHRQVIVFSNELMDAFPVHIVKRSAEQWFERMVADGGERFIWRERQLSEHEPLHDYVNRYYPQLHDGQLAEINLQAVRWLQTVAAAVKSGWLLTVDYGDVAAELGAAHRMAGTLLCYHQHKASDEPFERVGMQDITAHVNFSALMDAGVEAGLQTARYQTQRDFLTENGLLEKLSETLEIRDPFHPLVKRNRQIRQLLLSDRMSELFKVLIQQK